MFQNYFSKSMICTMLLVLGASDAMARIKLITLPVRERIEIQLDHKDVTLVEEERIVPLIKGLNQVDFSWANTLIDQDTIVFRVSSAADEAQSDIRVLSVSYPPGENALIWSVFAAESGTARVRISYVLGGLDKHYHYRAVAEQDETTLTLSQYMRITNQANEDFADAFIWAGFGEQLQKTIGLDETKEVLLEKFRQVPVQKTYTCDAAEFGYRDRVQNKLNVPMHYVLRNDRENGLGQAALPYGKARIFQKDGYGGTAFIGEDWGRYTAIDDEMKLYLGQAQDITVKRTVADNRRERIRGNLYRHEIVLKYEIENFKDEPVTLDLAESINHVHNEIIGSARAPEWRLGDETTLADPDPEKSDFNRIVFNVELPARVNASAEKITHTLHLVFNNEW